MTDRRLHAGRTRRRSNRWPWLLVVMLVVLLAGWYRFERPTGAAAPAPPAAEHTAGAHRIERPGREPRQLDRGDSGRSDSSSGGEAPAGPPVPLSPRP